MRKLVNLFLVILFFSCSTNSDPEFELCSEDKRPYYYPALQYKGGFYTIKNHFYNNYNSSENSNISGIVKIRFDVNCKGETGNFKINTYTLDYKDTIIVNQVTKQLLQLTKNLKDWIPASENGKLINSYKFFAFKLSNGKLIDILPK